MMTIYLSKDDAISLEYEWIPLSAKVQLTRLLYRHYLPHAESHPRIHYLNRIVNQANNLTGRKIFLLDADQVGDYFSADIARQESEFMICIRRLNPIQFIEFLATVVELGYIKVDDANAILKEANSSVTIKLDDSGRVSTSTISTAGQFTLDNDASPNLRTLVSRMDRYLNDEDYAGVLSNSAMAIELISKEIYGSSKIYNQSFGSYFEGYKNKTTLPEPVIDWMLQIYKRRNTEPLAAHGSPLPPSITCEEASLIAEMTKAFIRYESRMQCKVSSS
jgi:hypothetical protein